MKKKFLNLGKQPIANSFLTSNSKKTLTNEFFYLLDNDVEKIRDHLTDDYMIYEVSRKWNTEEFIEFVKGFGKFKSKREFKNIVIDTDINSAHISLEHTGEFELETPTPDGATFLSYEWLESAYLVKEDGKLKFKFYFSETINNSTSTIVE